MILIFSVVVLIFAFTRELASGTFGWETDGQDSFRTLSLKGKKGNEEQPRRLQNLNPLELSESWENGFDLI